MSAASELESRLEEFVHASYGALHRSELVNRELEQHYFRARGPRLGWLRKLRTVDPELRGDLALEVSYIAESYRVVADELEALSIELAAAGDRDRAVAS